MSATAASGPAADIAATPVEQKTLLTIAVMMATVMQILDTTIANVALPHMQTALGATADTITWVLTSYIVASAIAIPITGWLSDRVGSRNLFLAAVAGFVLASMLCGTATSLEEMVAFRVLQGISAAFINPLSQTVMMDINPPSKQVRAMTIWGQGIIIGPILGPVLGGWLTDNFDWRWCFYVNVPFGIVTLAVMWALLPAKPLRPRRFDLFGFSLLALAVASFQIMLDRGQQADWFDSWEIRIEAAIALGAAWMFGVHMFTGKAPMFERALLTNRNMATGLFFMVVIGVIMFATMALLPPMLQRIWNYSVVDAGALLAPRGVGVLVTMTVAGKLMGKVDPRWLVGTGMTLAALSLWEMTSWSLGMDRTWIIISGALQGLGMGLVFLPLNLTAFGTLDPKYRTDGASLLNLFRSIGASAGISVVTTFLGRNLQTSHSDIAGNVTSFNLPAMDPSQAQRLGTFGDTALAMLDAEVNRQALMIAYLDDFKLMAIVTLCAVPLVLLLRRPRGRPAADEHHAMEM
ncbi:DHA2 family efflux MFS transporter permease subunit [Sphingomonas sp. ID1715]|uniref:DHA2 family efflux MFS transporter permease subunit n=1 Tax=Sphingomonas sp. ID1715 TaxID=1656898 RepID=UPI001487BE12|nr:DHA2 family efflux MFS transporter permease subunit [Sphingomonas sp. ID1715]NNM78360.1 DHA2 family efflux MFS transporter permease subunit [Sphingomonas sp. ID1715]